MEGPNDLVGKTLIQNNFNTDRPNRPMVPGLQYEEKTTTTGRVEYLVLGFWSITGLNTESGESKSLAAITSLAKGVARSEDPFKHIIL